MATPSVVPREGFEASQRHFQALLHVKLVMMVIMMEHVKLLMMDEREYYSDETCNIYDDNR